MFNVLTLGIVRNCIKIGNQDNVLGQGIVRKCVKIGSKSTKGNDSIHIWPCFKIECGFSNVLRYGSAEGLEIGYSSAQCIKVSSIVLR